MLSRAAIGVLYVALVARLLRASRAEVSHAEPLWAIRVGWLLCAAVGAVVAFYVLPLMPLGEDDWQSLAAGQALANGSSDFWLSMWTEHINPREPYLRPANLPVFALLSALFGTSWPLWHLFTLVLHAVTATMVFRLALALTERRGAAWTAALVFAIHPVHAETLGSINAIETTVLGAFFVGAVLAHVHERWLLATILAALAILTKEHGAAVVGAIGLVDLVRYKHVRLRPWTWLGPVLALVGFFVWRAALAEPDNAAHVEYLKQFGDVSVLEAALALLVDAPVMVLMPVVDGLTPWSGAVALAVATASGALLWSSGLERDDLLRASALGGLWLVGLALPLAADIELPAYDPRPELPPSWNTRHLYVALVGPAIAFGWMVDSAAKGWRVRIGALAVLGALSCWHITAVAEPGQRQLDAAAAFRAEKWPDHMGVRVVEPLDPLAALILFNGAVDPDWRGVPVLVGEPRCGCAAMPVAASVPGETMRELTARFFAPLRIDPVDPGAPCTCKRWRADAEWRFFDGNRFTGP